ncbi:MAG: MlaD family protein [Candidatus Binataceae bacterium]
MPASDYAKVRVGLVIAAGLAILVVAIYSIGSGTRWLRATQTLQTHFHRTNGLQVGAPVALSGVTIGAVESVDFPSDPRADYIVVRMWVESRAAERISEDSVANIRTMGLLGDKYIEIIPGPSTIPLRPGGVLASQDPFDYEALLAKKNAGDFFGNLMQASTAARNILTAIDKGQGLLGQLIRGDQSGVRVSLLDLKQSLKNINDASAQLASIVSRVNRGQGLAGALMVDSPRNRRMLRNLDESLVALRVSAQRIDQLTASLGNGEGLIPQLMRDREFADQILRDTRESIHQLEEILVKINGGQGTLGKLVNDPSLYYQTKSVLGGGGWGTTVLRGLYGITHPFTDAQEPGAGSRQAITPSDHSLPEPKPPANVPSTRTSVPAGNVNP